MSQITFRVGGPPPMPSGERAHHVLPKARHSRKLKWVEGVTAFLLPMMTMLAYAAPYIAKLQFETLWWWPNGWYR